LTSNTLTIGVNPNAFPGQYPALHEGGGTRMPKRPVYEPLAKKLEQELPDLLNRYLARSVSRV
ncbi:hypothetical protein, partial [Lacisediminihabitans profunda]|uniref:hypothetical protein n=1 Tax=Lacisediminihabitans profunda TaxID=2594790 RepID=UPI001C9BD372